MSPRQQPTTPGHQCTFVDDGVTNVGSFSSGGSGLPAWVVLGLCIASAVGVVIGITAYPEWWVLITATALVQVLISLAGLAGSRRPVLWAIAVALVGLCSAVVHPVLGELAYSGAQPWIGLGTAVAALNLYLSARGQSAVTVGSAALVLSSGGLALVSIRAGTPVAPAIMATSLYLLLGVLAAVCLHLRNARQDRLRAPAITHRDPIGTPDGAIPHEEGAAARRALAIVALRSDELAATSSEQSVRHIGTDLRDIARRALAPDGALSSIPVELAPLASAPAEGTSPTGRRAEAVPELSDRDRELLRLIATGATNAAIARSLYLSEATVKQYVSRLMRRFDRENRTQLALMAARWFDPE